MRAATFMLLISLGAAAFAQPPRGAAPSPPRSPRAAAPVDLTGYWVSVVSEDWRWRMLTPTRGDFQSVPLNAEGRRVGLEWDPERDAAAGEQCKAYGAPALLRIPGRLRISWQDDETLKIETDAGTQTRLLKFDVPPTTSDPPSWQGHSVAHWEQPVTGALKADGLGIFSGFVGRNGRALEVQTTNLRPGYLRKNGPPYSANTTLEEFFDVHVQPNGDEWFTVTTIVTDPIYLQGPFITSTDFKKEPNGDRFEPTPCTAR